MADENNREAVTAWLKSGAYLPSVIRDFHDQKDLFKAIDEVRQRSVTNNGGSYMRDLSWIDAQVYTIDIFLWMMARHGYTLQRARHRKAFDDMDTFVGDAKRRNDAAAALALGLIPMRAASSAPATASQSPPESGGSRDAISPSSGSPLTGEGSE